MISLLIVRTWTRENLSLLFRKRLEQVHGDIYWIFILNWMKNPMRPIMN